MTTHIVQHWFASVCGSVAANAASFVGSLLSSRKFVRRFFLLSVLILVAFGGLAVAQYSDPYGGDPALMVANGQIPPPPAGPGLARLSADMAQAVDSAIAALSSNPDIASAGQIIYGFSILLMMAWTGFKVMGSGKGIGELIGEWVPIWIAAAVVFALIDQNGRTQIVAFMDSLAGSIAGIPVNNAAQLLPNIISKTMGTVTQIAGMPTVAPSFVEGAITMGLGGILLDMLVVGILKLIAVMLVAIGSAVYIAIALFSMVAVSLVLALSPIMVPFLIFTPLSWIFDSWLRFLLGACMMKVVGAFMLQLTGALLTRMTDVALLAAIDTRAPVVVADATIYAFVVLFCGVAALLMAQVPSIATGLLQGNAGGAGFRGIGGITQNTGFRMATAAGRAATGAGYQKTLGQAMAGHRAKGDQAAGLSAQANPYKNNSQRRAYMLAHKKATDASRPPATTTGANQGGGSAKA